MSPAKSTVNVHKNLIFAIQALIFATCFPIGSKAQITLPFNRERQAFKMMEEGQWRKARNMVDQALQRDSASVEGWYVLASWFFNAANPRYHLDSARILCTKTEILFKATSTEDRQRLKKFPLDSALLQNLDQQIEMQTYRITLEKKSLPAFERFLALYPKSIMAADAIRSRDSIAFSMADARHSSMALQEFLNRYPNSRQASLAREKFHRLIFEETTAPGTTESFELFLNRYADNPWRETALEKVYAARTRDGHSSSFQSFAAKYKGTELAARALAINASKNLTMGRGRWIPFVEKNKLGFIGIDGRLILSPRYDSVPEAIRCSYGDEGIFPGPDGGYTRDGRAILPGNFEHIEYLGSGFLLIAGRNNTSGLQIRHISGWEPVNSDVQRAVLLDGRFLGIKRKGKWELRGINGIEILPAVYDSLQTIAAPQSQDQTNATRLVVLGRSNRYYLLDEKDLLSFADGKAEFRIADQILPLAENALLLRMGFIEEVVDAQLKTIVPPDRQRIRHSPAGFLVEKNGVLTIQHWPGLENKPFEKIDFRSPWMRTIRNDRHQLYQIADRSTIISDSDSIWFDATLAFAQQGDSVKMITPHQQQVTIGRSDQVKLLIARDSSVYYLVRNKTRLQLYDARTARRVVQGAYSDIIPVNKNLFQVRLKNKWGLVQSGGKEVLRADYDAMVFQNGWFSLLRDGRFGGFNPTSNQFLKASFDANLVVFSDDLLLARKAGLWGFIKQGTKPEKATYLYDEVKAMGDSLVLVRRKENWTLIRAYEQTPVQDYIQSWSGAGRSGDVLIRVASRYGLLRLDGQFLAQPHYSEINWVTDDNHILYIAFLPAENGNVKVEYINDLGIVVRRTSVREDQVDLLLCDD